VAEYQQLRTLGETPLNLRRLLLDLVDFLLDRFDALIGLSRPLGQFAQLPFDLFELFGCGCHDPIVAVYARRRGCR
jgi:hypothetical protein